MYKVFCSLLLVVCCGSAAAQDRFSPFVPSDEDDVKRMLKLAEVRDGDVVFDLGSGDGRIVMQAARANPGVSGRGIEIDAELVEKSRAAAKAEGLADRVEFVHQNAFDADLKEATVIAMWLWPEVMRMLRPKILREARPGTRVVTRTWNLGSWPPDRIDKDGTEVYVWVVPAKVEGEWQWEHRLGSATRTYSAVMEQRFQTAEGVARVNHRRGLFHDVKLDGDRIVFSMLVTVDGLGTVRHQYSGRVQGDVIEGTVAILHEPYEVSYELPWRATRTAQSEFFAPTGVDVR